MDTRKDRLTGDDERSLSRRFTLSAPPYQRDREGEGQRARGVRSRAKTRAGAGQMIHSWSTFLLMPFFFHMKRRAARQAPVIARTSLAQRVRGSIVTRSACEGQEENW